MEDIADEIGVAARSEIANMEDRHEGYRQHMKEFGLEVNRDWIITDLANANVQRRHATIAHDATGDHDLPQIAGDDGERAGSEDKSR